MNDVAIDLCRDGNPLSFFPWVSLRDSSPVEWRAMHVTRFLYTAFHPSWDARPFDIQFDDTE